jgi:hypothetical protein
MVGCDAGSDDYLHTGIRPGHKNRQKLRGAQPRSLHRGYSLLGSADHRFCLTDVRICCRTLRGLRSDGAVLCFFHFSRMAPHHWHFTRIRLKQRGRSPYWSCPQDQKHGPPANLWLRRRLRAEDALEALAVLKEDQYPQCTGHQSARNARRRERQVKREDVVELRR